MNLSGSRSFQTTALLLLLLLGSLSSSPAPAQAPAAPPAAEGETFFESIDVGKVSSTATASYPPEGEAKASRTGR